MTHYGLQSIPDAPLTATASTSGDKSLQTMSETKLCRTVPAERLFASSWQTHRLLE